MTDKKELVIAGAGGGKGGGSYHVPVEDENTLQSTQTVRIVDVISEGEIEGLVDGEKSIFFNDTPLKTKSGTYTFKNVRVQFNTGLPDQTPLPGIPGVEAEMMVNAEVTHDFPKNSGSGDGSQTRSITNINATSVRVTIRVPALTLQDKDDGDLHGSSVEFNIAVRDRNSRVIVSKQSAIEGKTTSPYERSYLFQLADNGPWTVTVTRATKDNDKAHIQNDLYWASYTEIVDTRLACPYTAIVAVQGDAEGFNGQVPYRAYDVKGLKIQVPSNYDPLTREYSGIWDGAFKTAWTDNPAWVFYDLVINDRYGLGDKISEYAIDKWSLYQIAQYCDQLVPDGFGGMEPRFTFNYQIQGRSEAYKVLQSVASCFRGMTYWSTGLVTAKADMPADPVKLVTPANVIDGHFDYSGTGLKARHSAALITWNDPADGYKAAIEVVEDAAAIAKYGWRPVEKVAYGCTSRGQAHRYGRWVLYVEQSETETVAYTAGFDHADLMPGDIISIADPAYANVRFGGRLVAVDDAKLTLDAPVTLSEGETYTVSVTMPDGPLEERNITTGAGKHSQVMMDSALSGGPVPGAVWVITGTDVAPRQFRVLNIRETEKHQLAIEAIEYNVQKYLAVEQNLALDPPSYTRPTEGEVVPPTNITLTESSYYTNGLPMQRITVSWTLATDPMISAYEAQYMPPAGQWVSVSNMRTNGFDIEGANEGQYRIRVRSVAMDGRRSQWAEAQIFVQGKSIPPGRIENLTVEGGFQHSTLTWTNPNDPDFSMAEVWVSGTELIENAVKVAETRSSSYVHTGLKILQVYWYWVRAVDFAGNLGAFVGPISCVTQGLQPIDIPEMSIDKSKLADDISTKIDKVDPLQQGLSDLDVRQSSNYESIAESTINALVQTSRNTDVMRDASIAVDPKDGTVKIEALEIFKDKEDEDVTNLQSQIDIHAGDIALRATKQQVDSKIAAAQLDPNGQNLFDGLQGQITTNAAEIAINTQGVSANASEITVIKDDVTSINGQVTQNTANIEAVPGQINEATQTVRTDLDAQKERITTAESIISSNEGKIAQQVIDHSHILDSSEDLAETTIRGLLTDSKNIDRRREGIAVAKQELSAEVDEGISAEASARTELAAQVGDNSAAIEQTSTALANLDGTVKAQWMVKLDTNGNVAGISLMSDGNTREFAINADKFSIVDPAHPEIPMDPFTVQVVNGIAGLYLNGSLLATGTINGDILRADSKIQIGDGGKLIVGDGGSIQIGNSVYMGNGRADFYDTAFRIIDSSNPAHVTTPFEITNGVATIKKASIAEATIEDLHIKDRAVSLIANRYEWTGNPAYCADKKFPTLRFIGSSLVATLFSFQYTSAGYPATIFTNAAIVPRYDNSRERWQRIHLCITVDGYGQIYTAVPQKLGSLINPNNTDYGGYLMTGLSYTTHMSKGSHQIEFKIYDLSGGDENDGKIYAEQAPIRAVTILEMKR